MELINVSRLRKPKRKAKKLDQELLKSVEKDGILKPILVRKDLVIYDGLQRYLIALKLNITTVPIRRDE